MQTEELIRRFFVIMAITFILLTVAKAAFGNEYKPWPEGGNNPTIHDELVWEKETDRPGVVGYLHYVNLPVIGAGGLLHTADIETSHGPITVTRYMEYNGAENGGDTLTVDLWPSSIVPDEIEVYVEEGDYHTITFRLWEGS